MTVLYLIYDFNKNLIESTVKSIRFYIIITRDILQFTLVSPFLHRT